MAEPPRKLTKTVVDKLPLPEAGKEQRVYFDSEMKGFCVRVTAAGAKTYVVEKRVNGKTRRVSIGATNVWSNEEAREKAQKLLAEMGEGVDPKAAKAERKQKEITLAEVVEGYKQKRELKPRTLAIYDNVLSRYLSDWLDMPVTALSREMVEKRLEQIANTNGPRGQGRAMAGQTYRLLRSLVRFSQAEHEVNGKPIIEIDPTRNLSEGRTWTKSVRREGVVQKHQLADWFKAVGGLRNRTIKDYLIFTLLTGLRRQEALGLKWTEVSLPGAHIRIDASRTKNGKEHGLPLSDYLHELLKDRLQVNQLESPFVFPGRDLSKPLKEPKRALEQIAKVSGIKFMVHDLRRTFITVAESLDVPAYALKKLVNHSTKNDVTAGYIVSEIERLRQPMQRITDFMLEQAGISEARHKQAKG
jgi:integrase